MVDAPCKDCKDRTATCHATCKKYQKYSKQREAERKAEFKKRELERKTFVKFKY